MICLTNIMMKWFSRLKRFSIFGVTLITIPFRFLGGLSSSLFNKYNSFKVDNRHLFLSRMNNLHYFLLGRNGLWICQKLFRLKYNAFYSLVIIFLYFHLTWRKTVWTYFKLKLSIENNEKSLSNTFILDFKNRASSVIEIWSHETS